MLGKTSQSEPPAVKIVTCWGKIYGVSEKDSGPGHSRNSTDARPHCGGALILWSRTVPWDFQIHPARRRSRPPAGISGPAAGCLAPKADTFLHPYYSFTISLTFCQWTVASFSFFCGSAAFFRRFDRYLFTFIDSFIGIVPSRNFPRRVLSAARSAGPTALLCRRPSKNPAEISFLFAKSMVTSA